MLRYTSSELIAAANPNALVIYPSTVISIPFLQNSTVKTRLSEFKRTDWSSEQRVFVHFEELCGKGSFPIVDVHLNIGRSPESSDQNYVGSLGLYGLQESSTPSLERKGEGMSAVLDVSSVMQRLTRVSGFSDEIFLTLTPTRELKSDEQLTVGRVAVFARSVE